MFGKFRDTDLVLAEVLVIYRYRAWDYVVYLLICNVLYVGQRLDDRVIYCLRGFCL